jgi:hypothetical protein
MAAQLKNRTLLLNDGTELDLTAEAVKQRWAEAERNDPFKTTCRLLEKKDYDGLVALIRKEEGTERQRLSIPAALLLARKVNYEALADEMRSRKAYMPFLFYKKRARYIAKKIEAWQKSKEYNPDELPQDYAKDEYERIYWLYKWTC